MIIIKTISSFFKSVAAFFVDWKESTKYEIKLAKEHFNVMIERKKNSDCMLDLVREYHKEYKYEIAVCHKRYNHGAWIILYRGDEYKSAVRIYNRLWSKLNHMSGKNIILKCIRSGNTYKWSDEPAIYSWDDENG